MFSEDSAACFEKDEAQSTLTELLEDLNIAAAVVPESCLHELWDAVAMSSKAIQKEHQPQKMLLWNYYNFLLAEKKRLQWMNDHLMNAS